MKKGKHKFQRSRVVAQDLDTNNYRVERNPGGGLNVSYKSKAVPPEPDFFLRSVGGPSQLAPSGMDIGMGWSRQPANAPVIGDPMTTNRVQLSREAQTDVEYDRLATEAQAARTNATPVGTQWPATRAQDAAGRATRIGINRAAEREALLLSKGYTPEEAQRHAARIRNPTSEDIDLGKSATANELTVSGSASRFQTLYSRY